MNSVWLAFAEGLLAWLVIGCVALAFLGFVPEAVGQDNGISVGPPKVFDNRSLQVMLQQFELSLQAAKLFDQGPLSSALGQIQGSQQTDIYRDLELTVSPTPKAPSIPPAAAAPTSGQASTDKKTTGASDTSPKPPAADTTSGTMPDISKKYGISAEDLLGEQVNLTYQIFNLRMLLERSLTDRDFEHQPRLQAVLGFEVSLNPPKRYTGNAAVVEVRLLPSAGSGNQPVSLVAMMPREKTYNVAALTTKVNQFGGAAVVKVVNVGYTERRRGQTFFLVKDTDTYAFQRTEKAHPGEGPDPLVFGWVFRPVLNMPAVEAGTRQMFAVVALPMTDSISQPNGEKDVYVEVKTYWLPYNRKTATVRLEPRDDSGRKQFSADVRLFPATRIDDDMRAKISQLSWSEVGEEGVLVNVVGDNFYNGTSAIIGSTVLTQPVNGLTVRDDHHLQALTTLRDFARGGIINGRYGTPLPLEQPELNRWKQASRWGLDASSFSWVPNSARTSVAIKMSFRTASGDVPDLHGQRPILIVGKLAIPSSRIGVSTGRWFGSKSIACLDLTADVPAESLATETTVEVSVPFLGEDYHKVRPVFEPSRFEKVVRLREDGKIVFGITGARLDQSWGVKVIADRAYELNMQTGESSDGSLRKVSDNLLELSIDKESLKSVRQFVIEMDDKTFVVPVPSGKAEPAKPMIDKTVQTVVANSSVGVVFQGKQLNSIKKVSFEAEDLKFELGEGGKAITIFVTRKVTSTAGLAELLCTGEDGNLVTAKLQIVAAASKAETEKK